MIYFWCSCLLIILSYSLLIITLSIGWSRLRLTKTEPPQKTKNTFISVIIAVRNEAEHVKQLIAQLSKQNRSHQEYEVIIIDDHSTDNTYKLLKELAIEKPFLKIDTLEQGKQGKKEALNLGIQRAKGELYAFTDGDCIQQNNWLNSLTNFYHLNNKPDLIIGLVDMKANNLLEHFFRIDFITLILSSTGAAILQHPIFCNGANLAVKASVFNNFKQYSGISSGDDVFLLHYLKKHKKNIKVLKSKDHIVESYSPKSISDFIEQRKRWASKAPSYTDFDTILVAIIVFLANSALLTILAISILELKFILLAITFCLKLTSDSILLWKGKDLFDYKKKLIWLPLISVVYPFYIVSTVFIAIKKPFQWKGRKLNK